MKITTAHTPGPWTSGPSRNIPQLDSATYIRAEDAFVIAKLDHGANDKANARLMAAAPELLIALTRLTECRDGAWATSNKSWAEAMVAARKALAKATGQTV